MPAIAASLTRQIALQRLWSAGALERRPQTLLDESIELLGNLAILLLPVNIILPSPGNRRQASFGGLGFGVVGDYCVQLVNGDFDPTTVIQVGARLP